MFFSTYQAPCYIFHVHMIPFILRKKKNMKEVLFLFLLLPVRKLRLRQAM